MQLNFLFKWIAIWALVCISFYCPAQRVQSLNEIKAPEKYENVYIQKIAEDSLQSCFIIWIKKNVKGHFHQWHTENIIVLKGKAEMTLGQDTLIIRAGDHINIPKNTPHAVLSVLSRKPIKVLSIQAPAFDGSDRIFVADP